MDKERIKFLLIRFIKYLNITGICGIFYIACKYYYFDQIAMPYGWRGEAAILGVFGLLYLIYCRIYHATLINLYSVSEIVYSQTLALLISDFMIYVVFILLSKTFPSPWPLFVAFFVQIIFSVVWAVLSMKAYYRFIHPSRMALIYKDEKDVKKISQIKMEKKSMIVRKIVKPNSCKEVCDSLYDIDAVCIIGISTKIRDGIIKYCIKNDIHVYCVAKTGDIILKGARNMSFLNLPILYVHRAVPSIEYLMIKRLIDILFSSVIVILLSPLMLMVAITIKASDGGPVLYSQNRLTKDGKIFKIYKFRSMYMDAEADGVARLATQNDTRITKIGRIMRRFRFDEIPQLFNIIEGSMSIVGPRPERPEIAAQYEEALQYFSLRLQVKAGLTGYAQVYGKYSTEPYEKLQMDLLYITKMSLVEDLRLMFATIKILFVRESTEGIQEDQVIASKNSDTYSKAI